MTARPAPLVKAVNCRIVVGKPPDPEAVPAAFGLSDLELKRLDRAVRRALSADDRAYVIRHAEERLLWNGAMVTTGCCFCHLCCMALHQVRREYARLAKRRVSRETVSAQVPA